MSERINIAAVLGCTVLIGFLVGGAGSAARAEDATRQDLQVLMAEAQQGVSEAQYRLGQHYEAQYDLGRTDPDAADDHTNLLLAYAWFQSAENSGHRDARYARIATEYALRAVYDEDQFRQAMESVQEWMKDQGPPPPLQTEAQPTAQPPAQAPASPVSSDLEDAAADAPPESSTETAAGDDGNGAEPDVAPQPVQTPAQAPVQTPDPASETTAKATGPDIEKLLARGTSFLEAGDLVSARGFFKLAAGRGSGNAAMLVGVTYDPGYLELVNVVGLRPDPEQAAAWYLKAIEMDNEEAESRLRALKRRLGQSP